MEPGLEGWREQSFDKLRAHICETIRQLDKSLGRPPFPNPSPHCCRALAAMLVEMLQHVRDNGRTTGLAECSEVNMTFPVLCAALTGGSEGRRPCPELMEKMLQGLCCVHGLAACPLQSVLHDAREVLPRSPATFCFIVAVGAMTQDTMRFFLGLPLPCEDKPNQQPRQKKKNKSRKGERGSEQINSTGVRNKRECPPEDETATAVPTDLLKAMFDVALPPDCMPLLQSLFNSTSKFQRMVGDDSELAAHVLGVYGDYLLPVLRPTALLRCLDTDLLDLFIDVVQLHGASMTLLTEPVFAQGPLVEWAPVRLRSLMQQCARRLIRPEDAFGSLQVSAFLYRLVAAWERGGLDVSLDDELDLCAAALRAAQLMPIGDEKDDAVDSVARPLAVIATCVRRRGYTFAIIAAQQRALDVHTLLRRLTDSLRTKPLTTTKKGSSSSSSSSSSGSRSTNVCAALCLALSLAPLDVSVPESAAAVDACAHALSLDALCTRRPSSVAAAGAFLEVVSAALCAHSSSRWGNPLSLRAVAALPMAAIVTRRLSCAGAVAALPDKSKTADDDSTETALDAFATWPVRTLGAFLNAWLEGGAAPDPFFAPIVAQTATESLGLVAARFPPDRLAAHCRALFAADGEIARAWAPALERALAARLCAGNAVAASGLARLVESLRAAEVSAAAESLRRANACAGTRSASPADGREAAARAAEERREAEVRREAWVARVESVRARAEEKRREAAAVRAEEREAREARRRRALSTLAEMATRTREERGATHRARVAEYRARVAAAARVADFLDGLRIPASRAMNAMAVLRPYLKTITPDELLEFLVTGSREVPHDMRNPGDERGGCFFREEPVSFWDSVMRMVAQSGANNTNVDGEDGKDTRDGHDVDQGFSFHRRVAPALDLFDYAPGTETALQDPMPTLSLRCAARLLRGDSLSGTGFCDGREALLLCEKRGLCTTRAGLCTLTPLGFRYHFPFHDPEKTMEVQLEQRRAEVRTLVNSAQRVGKGEEEEVEEEEEEEEEEDVVRFADEIL